MPKRSWEIGPAEMQAARSIEILRSEIGLSQRRPACRVTAPGHLMSNITLSGVERLQRRCDVNDLIVIAETLLVLPLVLPQRPTAT
ncbi:XRE family transcriptional regulator [Streptomyces sp. NPDC059255]|uniref:XRE family transcriptional regulator n=1 Tax=Streptomyces sp. NPDC059255 TaxID=3346793 RepID=UPI0036C84493